MENKELSTSLNDLRYIAKAISYSSFCPESFKNKPFDILIAIQMGKDLSLTPWQSVKNICVIKGVPTLWGDSLLALVRRSKKMDYIREWQEEETAYCEVKRKGEPATICYFSMDDAKTAGLLGKDTWKKYPNRMLKMRARSFSLRDTFPDILCGIECAEEVFDYKDVKVNKKIYNNEENLLEQLKYEVSKKVSEKETMSKSNQLKDELSKKEAMSKSNNGNDLVNQLKNEVGKEENQLPDEFGEDTIPTDKGDDLLNQLQHSYEVS
jgi:hypothetical protein